MVSDKYILKDGVPVICEDLYEWGRYFENADRIVAKTNVTEEARVSTVFLGLDHSFSDGPPLVFETMVFGGSFNDEMDRYSTWEEAEAGHARMVERVRAILEKGN